MKPIHSSLALLVVLGPLAAGCGSADVQAQAPSAQVDVNAQVPPPPPADGTVAADGTAAPGGDSYDDEDPAALNDFHSALDAHGQWVDDPNYGTVWVPNANEVGPDFTPYSTSGHWAYDNDDYVWVSDYDWGWAPFHYGRWVYADTGWVWIPGREYRGAWVNWGNDDGYTYVGWYPMGPTYVWRGGVAVGYTYTAGPRWNYVGRGDVFAVNVGARVVRGSAAVAIAGRVHAGVPSGGGHAAGPAPGRLGYSGNQVPHVSGAAAASITKAQQFSHPSTAVSMGAHPPSHVSTGATTGARGEGHVTVGGSSAGTAAAGEHGGPPNNLHEVSPEHGAQPAAHVGQQPVQVQPKKKPAPQEELPAKKVTVKGRPGHH